MKWVAIFQKKYPENQRDFYQKKVRTKKRKRDGKKNKKKDNTTEEMSGRKDKKVKLKKLKT